MNPDAEPDNLDWDSLDPTCNFNENLENMSVGNPDYVWEEETLEMIEGKILDHEIEEMMGRGASEEEIDRFVEQSTRKKVKGWTVEKTSEGLAYSSLVKIKAHMKGKYGRIQISCPPEFIGLNAKVTFVKHEKPKEKPSDWELAEYES